MEAVPELQRRKQWAEWRGGFSQVFGACAAELVEHAQ